MAMAQTSTVTVDKTLEREGREILSRIPATMRAAVYRGINDVRMEEVQVPEIGRGEILLRVHTCGICGTDLKKIATGSHTAPRIFGHETAGVVARVGEGVRKFGVGDRVVVFHHIPCGECFYCHHKTFAQCATYKKVGCTAGFDPSGGGFAEYVRVMDWIVEKGTAFELVIDVGDHPGADCVAMLLVGRPNDSILEPLQKLEILERKAQQGQKDLTG